MSLFVSLVMCYHLCILHLCKFARYIPLFLGLYLFILCVVSVLPCIYACVLLRILDYNKDCFLESSLCVLTTVVTTLCKMFSLTINFFK